MAIAAILLGLAFNLAAGAQTCTETAKVVVPQMSDETRKGYETRLAEARDNLASKPDDADAMIWVGRRLGYIGDYKEAIAVFSKGADQFPKDARFLRHRGHRYITLRCFDDAVRDFAQAAKLIKGKPDEIEPDGLPNAKNIPTSTLQSNIWYHLGLAYYVKGDLKKALKAYKEAEKVSTNPDMLAATTHWHYMTLRRLEKEKDAARVLEPFGKPVEVIENDDYYKLIKLYRGELKAEALIKELGGEANSLGSASMGYGLGNWYLYYGKRKEAMDIFRRIVAGDQWASFGFIAAEAALERERVNK